MIKKQMLDNIEGTGPHHLIQHHFLMVPSDEHGCKDTNKN